MIITHSLSALVSDNFLKGFLAIQWQAMSADISDNISPLIGHL